MEKRLSKLYSEQFSTFELLKEEKYRYSDNRDTDNAFLFMKKK